MGVRTRDATLRARRSFAHRRYGCCIAPLTWISLIGALGALLAIDLFFAHRSAASLRAAAGWSGLWMAVGVAFGLVLLATVGARPPAPTGPAS
jgi:hypothetical protein